MATLTLPTPAQDAHDHADVLQRLYAFNAARYGHTPRVERLRERALNARRDANALSARVEADLSDADALEAESWEIDDAGREIGISGDVMRYENEIRYLRSQLANADLLSATRCHELREAERDLAQAKWELMQQKVHDSELCEMFNLSHHQLLEYQLRYRDVTIHAPKEKI